MTTCHMLATISAAVLSSAALSLAAPPGRPVPVSREQFAALRQFEAQPAHRATLALRATYQSARERSLEFTTASDDFWTAAWTIGWPGTVLTLIILAAPF